MSISSAQCQKTKRSFRPVVVTTLNGALSPFNAKLFTFWFTQLYQKIYISPSCDLMNHIPTQMTNLVSLTQGLIQICVLVFRGMSIFSNDYRHWFINPTSNQSIKSTVNHFEPTNFSTISTNQDSISSISNTQTQGTFNQQSQQKNSYNILPILY